MWGASVCCSDWMNWSPFVVFLFALWHQRWLICSLSTVIKHNGQTIKQHMRIYAAFVSSSHAFPVLLITVFLKAFISEACVVFCSHCDNAKWQMNSWWLCEKGHKRYFMAYRYNDQWWRIVCLTTMYWISHLLAHSKGCQERFLLCPV